MYLFLKITMDKYELPLIVAGSIREMAKLSGTTENNITSQLHKAKKGIIKRCQYKKVWVDNDE